MAKQLRTPWVAVIAGVEKIVLEVMIRLVVAVVGRQLRKRLRVRSGASAP